MTLRTRLVILLSVIIVAVAATGVVIVAAQRQFLVGQVDDQLRASSGPVARLVLSARDGVPPPGPTGPNPAGGVQPQFLSEMWIGVLPAGGSVVSLSAPGLQTTTEPAIDAARVTALVASGRPETVAARQGRGDFRVVAFRAPGRDEVVVLALSLDRIDGALGRLERTVALGAGVVAAVVALVGWWVWRLGIRPIRRMTRTADAITRGDLHHRVEPPPARTEAGHLAQALNTMLDERQATEERLRQFVGDASHELRTPLTSIRGYADLYRRGGLRDPGDLDDAMRRVAGEANRMGGLIDDLLLLARLDQRRPLDREPVDLAVVLTDAAADAAAVEPDRDVRLQVSGQLTVVGDEARLRQVVAALVTNALVHTSAPVTVRGMAGPAGGVVVEVADEGPGMTPEVAAHAFERFYRGDAGRVRAQGGSGLGLAIVESIVHAHGGSVTIDSAPGRGTCVRVVFDGAAIPSELPGAVDERPRSAVHGG